jgi:hypothetical protein
MLKHLRAAQRHKSGGGTGPPAFAQGLIRLPGQLGLLTPPLCGPGLAASPLLIYSGRALLQARLGKGPRPGEEAGGGRQWIS